MPTYTAPLLEYNKKNLTAVSNSIIKNLTNDLVLRKYQSANKKKNTYGHCHNASACFYLIFRSKSVHLFRALDTLTTSKLNKDFWHYWIVDNEGLIIDLAGDHYSKSYRKQLYEKGVRANVLGFKYRKLALELLKKVRKDLNF
jgi:hypothetical protein